MWGASVTGNCREDVPASCEGGLGIKLRLPFLDGFVGNLLASAFDGLNGEGVDDVEDVGSNALVSPSLRTAGMSLVSQEKSLQRCRSSMSVATAVRIGRQKAFRTASCSKSPSP